MSTTEGKNPGTSLLDIKEAWRAAKALDGRRISSDKVVQDAYDQAIEQSATQELSSDATQPGVPEKVIATIQEYITSKAHKLLENPLLIDSERARLEAAVQEASVHLQGLSQVIVETNEALKQRSKQSISTTETTLPSNEALKPTSDVIAQRILNELIVVDTLPPEAQENELMSLVTPEVAAIFFGIQAKNLGNDKSRSVGFTLRFLDRLKSNGKNIPQLLSGVPLGEPTYLEMFARAKRIALNDNWKDLGLAAVIDSFMSSHAEAWQKASPPEAPIVPESKESLLKNTAGAIDAKLGEVAALLSQFGITFKKTEIVNVLQSDRVFSADAQKMVDGIYSQFQTLNQDIPRASDPYSAVSMPTYEWIQNILPIPSSPSAEDLGKLEQQKQEYSARFSRVKRTIEGLSAKMEKYALLFDRDLPQSLKALLSQVDTQLASYDKLVTSDPRLAHTLPPELAYVQDLYNHETRGRRSTREKPYPVSAQISKFGFETSGDSDSLSRVVETRRSQCQSFLQDIPESQQRIESEFEARQKNIAAKLIKGVTDLVPYGWRLTSTEGGDLTLTPDKTDFRLTDEETTQIVDGLSGKTSTPASENKTVQAIIKGVQNPEMVATLNHVENLKRIHVSDSDFQKREAALQELTAISRSSRSEGVVQLAKTILAQIQA